jgi:type I restriction enzyme S subunit
MPPPSVQHCIVAEIEKQLTRLDAGVASLKRVQIALKRYRASVLKAACEGRLVLTEAELARREGRTYETGGQLLSRILNERRMRTGRWTHKEPSVPKVTEFHPLPDGWTWATFDQIAERVTVGHVGSMKHEYVADGIPFLRSQNVRENRFDPDGLLHIGLEFHARLAKSIIRSGDLAVVRSGSVGITCVIPETLGEANCADLVLIQQPLAFVPQYGAYYMNSLAKRHVNAGKVGVALTHFNTKSVAALPVPLPPLAEQKRIVAEVERRLSVIEESEATVTANLKRSERLRQSILHRAFAGKL